MNQNEDKNHNESEVFRLILEAHTRPISLTHSEIIAHINKPFNFGSPRVVNYKGLGRKSRKTQYDLAFERRKVFTTNW
jgi:hypothetical protein